MSGIEGATRAFAATGGATRVYPSKLIRRDGWPFVPHRASGERVSILRTSTAIRLPLTTTAPLATG
jgi:hypothetical protein